MKNDFILSCKLKLIFFIIVGSLRINSLFNWFLFYCRLNGCWRKKCEIGCGY